MSFVHLHVHSYFSVLDGMSKVTDLVDKAMSYGMHSIALTDHGNMYGCKELWDYVNKVNGKPKKAVKECKEAIEKASTEAEKKELEEKLVGLQAKLDAFIPFKPILGVEAYCARRTLYDKDKNVKAFHANGKEYIIDSSGWHLILLAKNKVGYHNLCKIVSKAFLDGFYNRPRIDKNILKEHHEGIICCSACIGGEIPQLIMDNKIEEAEASVRWFKSVFGDDYYLELQRHKTDKPNADTEVYQKQMMVAPIMIDIARKTNTKIIATNDVHFVEEEHAEAHDRLICLSTGKLLTDTDRMHYTKQEWLKSPEQMATIFADLPEALENTQEISDKVETYTIESDPIMPAYDIPESFGTVEEYKQKFTEKDLFDEFTRNEKGEVVLSEEEANKKIEKLGGYQKLYRIKLEADYLSKLAWEGAKKRYGENLTEEQHERIVFELHIMKTMGFPGYFLIVQDYIRAAREELDVSVGPGRGSAAGSVVAYCLRITDVDPLKYDLLFERFLNPDRISLPDIDVDFDDDGRAKVLDWVVQKYGKERVAHIITYGTMATKSSIKDVGRVQNVPLAQVNKIVSYIPAKFGENLKDPKTEKIPKVNVKNCIKYIPEINQARYGDDKNVASMIEYAQELEGTVRQTGIHACGVIIGADDLTKFAPLSIVKDRATGKDIVVTEYDGHVVESVGLIKMDFLGLANLSVIKEALKNIKLSKGIDLDIDAIPIDDKKTFELYSQGRTVGVFQFESAGMQKYLRELQPSAFEDLIAMNALYRPGPMDYIPQFIRRKHGEEPITYDIPVMERYLKDTYGITVYQEQVMLLSRLLAGFTRGQSDALRKAMGKKLKLVLDDLKPKFIDGGKANGHDPEILNKIWADWEKFASYAFNKSHATCYAWVSFQTAYLKAHYPAEYMAAILTRNKDDIKEVTKFMEECKAMDMSVLGPDVNESYLHFTSDANDNIRFGLGGVKGVGEGAVEAIVNERQKNGKYKDSFDFFERVNLSACNRKAIENLIAAGAFDSFGDISREQFLTVNQRGETYLEQLIHYANKFQTDNCMEGSLFENIEVIEVQRPLPPAVQPWSVFEKLNKEKDLIGIYLSAHPLDDYQTEIKLLTNVEMEELNNPVLLEERFPNPNQCFYSAGVIRSVEAILTARNFSLTKFSVEGYAGTHEFVIPTKNLGEYKNQLFENNFVLVTSCLTYSWRAEKARKAIDAHLPIPQGCDPNEKNITVTNVSALADYKGKIPKKITLNIPLSWIDSDKIAWLNTYLADMLHQEDTHKSDLWVNIYDTDNGMSLDTSSKLKIPVTYKLLLQLDTWSGISSYKAAKSNANEGDDVVDKNSDDENEEVEMMDESALNVSMPGAETCVITYDVDN